MRETVPNTVICQYRPRSEEIYVGEDQDGSGPLVMSIFPWVNDEASGRAHLHPRIGVVGEKMATLVGDRSMGPGMAFSHFEVKETL